MRFSSLRARRSLELAAVVGATALGSFAACSSSVDTSGSGATATSSNTTSSTGGGGGQGGSGSVTQSVAIGGCYDTPGCGYPLPEGQFDGCVSCEANSDCASQRAACDADAECTAILTCVASCSMPSCVASCTQQHPNGGDAYRALLTCGICGCGLTGVCNDEAAAIEPPIVCPK